MTTLTVRRSDRAPARHGERLTPAEKRKRVRELADRIQEYRDSLSEDDLLAKMALFPGYSLNNKLAILMQRPDATMVRGYRQWQQAGFQVRKGERGIAILAPAGEYVVDAAQVDDPDGNEDEPKVKRFYRIAYVFDISQTDPKESTS